MFQKEENSNKVGRRGRGRIFDVFRFFCCSLKNCLIFSVQAMRFGDLPFWAVELSDQIHEVVCFGDKEGNIGKLNLDNETYVLPPQLLSRDPFFDQLIVNVYQPGEVRFGCLVSYCL